MWSLCKSLKCYAGIQTTFPDTIVHSPKFDHAGNDTSFADRQPKNLTWAVNRRDADCVLFTDGSIFAARYQPGRARRQTPNHKREPEPSRGCATLSRGWHSVRRRAVGQ